MNSRKKKEEPDMSRIAVCRLLASVLALALAVSVLTAPASAKETKAVARANITLSSPLTLAGTQLAAGSYQLIADQSKVTVKKDG
jgi:hypothetical protein